MSFVYDEDLIISPRNDRETKRILIPYEKSQLLS